MRRPQPRPKDRRPVPIPPELRAALAEVHDLIHRARRDPDVDLSHDDAIQAGDGLVCGGRFGTKHHPFVLTYYPTGDADRGRWSLSLHPTEIEDIADGHLPALTLSCCTAPTCRMKFRDADELCFFCDYADDGVQGA